MPKMKGWWQKKQASMGALNTWKRFRKAIYNVTVLFLWLLNDLSQVKGLYSTGLSMNDGKVKFVWLSGSTSKLYTETMLSRLKKIKLILLGG